ncbi:hypothetical protein PIB30_076292 [Stylosanthes scabra]|uniref:Uncharacterized protein n=1 Tax=Stylosanthes scabra TaxID=79078 RepID=A0ABU6XQJ4_9FABA|nr:hypothetical protein [Stylosanthes scabra]
MAAPQLEFLRLVGCPEMDFSPTGDPPCSLRSLEISYSNKLVSSATLMNSQFHGLTHARAGLAHLTSLQQLPILFCPKLENIQGEMLPASLLQLTITYSPLLGKRCQMKNPQLNRFSMEPTTPPLQLCFCFINNIQSFQYTQLNADK